MADDETTDQPSGWAREGAKPEAKEDATKDGADQSNADFLADLERESKLFDKDTEIDRIMNALRLNSYEVMNLVPGVSDTDIKKIYRSKSLLIHPDKTDNPRAPEAFDRLAKANQELQDEKHRERLDGVFADARRLVMRDHKWTVDSPELKQEHFLKTLWPERTRQLLMEDEWQKRRQAQAQMREEGRQQRMGDEITEKRKRKREADQKWEEGRDDRVSNWRTFVKSKGGSLKQTGKEKSKKQKKNKDGIPILG